MTDSLPGALTTEQKLKLEQVRRMVQQLPLETLQDYCVTLTQQQMRKDNITAHLLKQNYVSHQSQTN
mgnify:CR=1 FL=1